MSPKAWISTDTNNAILNREEISVIHTETAAMQQLTTLWNQEIKKIIKGWIDLQRLYSAMNVFCLVEFHAVGALRNLLGGDSSWTNFTEVKRLAKAACARLPAESHTQPASPTRSRRMCFITDSHFHPLHPSAQPERWYLLPLRNRHSVKHWNQFRQQGLGDNF